MSVGWNGGGLAGIDAARRWREEAPDCIGKGLTQEGRDEEWTWGFGSDWNARSIVDETSDFREKKKRKTQVGRRAES